MTTHDRVQTRGRKLHKTVTCGPLNDDNKHAAQRLAEIAQTRNFR